MATLYLIDQSLRDEGSHHADYVLCVAQAAKEAGYEVVIGAHRGLPLKPAKIHLDLGAVGAIRTTFNNTTYQKCSELAGLQRMKRLQRNFGHGVSKGPPQPGHSLAGLIAKFQAHRLQRKQDSVIRQFARDCGTFFHQAAFSACDHIFFASISDLELIGLANYLARTPQTLRAQWHVQFHFNLLEGRPPEYEQQASILQVVRKQLTAALAPLVYHNLNFYSTTDELTEQYNQLGIGHFQTLAYPIATEFAPPDNLHQGLTTANMRIDSASAAIGSPIHFATPKSWTESHALNKLSESCNGAGNSSLVFAKEHQRERQWDQQTERQWEHSIDDLGDRQSRRTQRPLRVVCPGAIRREKGQGEYLPELIEKIDSSLLATNRIQLVVQQPEKKIGERAKLVLPGTLSNSAGDNISVLPHPLPRADYVQLIRSADIGLLYYDSRVYYSRRAGILGELLSIGKPVIVPAGCWLAEQLAEPIFRHAEKWFADREHRQLGLADLRWEIGNAPMHGGIVNFDDERRPFRFESELTAADTAVGLRFDWHWPSESGIYCRAEWEQLDEGGSVVAQGCQVLGHRLQRQRNQPSRKTLALIPIRAGASRIKFCLKNAFHHSSASLRNIELLIAGSDGISPASIPLGAVGVIVPDRESLAASLLEVVTHFEHYRDSAIKFSHEWFEQHHPAKTLSQLTATDQLATEVA